MQKHFAIYLRQAKRE